MQLPVLNDLHFRQQFETTMAIPRHLIASACIIHPVHLFAAQVAIRTNLRTTAKPE